MLYCMRSYYVHNAKIGDEANGICVCVCEWLCVEQADDSTMIYSKLIEVVHW